MTACYSHSSTGKSALNIAILMQVVLAAGCELQLFTDAEPPSDASALIANLVPANYETARLSVGDPYYVDRDFTLSSLRPGHEDWLWIRTANQDKSVTAQSFLSFDLLDDAVVAVGYDKRASVLPGWLQGWEEASFGVGVSDAAASPLGVWLKPYAAGPVVLGGNLAQGAQGSNSMYVLWLVRQSDLKPTAIDVRPASVILGMGETVQFNATLVDQLAQTINRSFEWSATGGSISSTGLYTAGVTPGTFEVSATESLSGVSGTGVAFITDDGGGSAPEPPPIGDPSLLVDTRAGGQHSIQSSSNLNDALAASGLSIQESCASGNCVGPGFSTNLDGSGTRAFIWNVKKDAGNPDGCVMGGPSQHNWKIWKGMGGTTGTIIVQYKYWSGQTPTGGGAAGNIGEFSHEGGANGHKDIVFFRPGTNDGRIQQASESRSPHAGQKILVQSVSGQPNTGTDGNLFAQVSFDKTDYINQTVVQTLRLVPDSSPGAQNGRAQIWMNGTLVLDYRIGMGTLGWGELQIGGPTWICPPQDQTLYFWDIVVWQPAG